MGFQRGNHFSIWPTCHGGNRPVQRGVSADLSTFTLIKIDKKHEISCIDRRNAKTETKTSSFQEEQYLFFGKCSEARRNSFLRESSPANRYAYDNPRPTRILLYGMLFGLCSTRIQNKRNQIHCRNFWTRKKITVNGSLPLKMHGSPD